MSLKSEDRSFFPNSPFREKNIQKFFNQLQRRHSLHFQATSVIDSGEDRVLFILSASFLETLISVW